MAVTLAHWVDVTVDDSVGERDTVVQVLEDGVIEMVAVPELLPVVDGNAVVEIVAVAQAQFDGLAENDVVTELVPDVYGVPVPHPVGENVALAQALEHRVGETVGVGVSETDAVVQPLDDGL